MKIFNFSAGVAGIVCALVAGLTTLAVSAQETTAAKGTNQPLSRPDQLKDVKVFTPTRGPKKPIELPYSVERVPGDRLREEKMAGSVPEALLETPGVMVQQTARGQGSPFLRGFTGFRTLLLVDGIRLNNSTFRDGPNQYWSTVDALAVDRLEVVKGPASVLYGSDAVGGTVNAFMRGPRYGFGDEVRWGGATYYRFGSAEDGHLARGEFSGALRDQWGFSLGLSGKTYGDVEGGRAVGRQPYTGYEQWDVDGKAEYFLSKRTKLTLAYQRTQQDDVNRTHRTIYGVTWEGLTHGTDRRHEFDQERELAYARLETATERGDQFKATVSWQRQDEFQFVQRANLTRQENNVWVNTLGLTLQGDSPSCAGLLTYGVEYYRDYVASAQRNYNAAGVFTSAGIQGPVADDSSYDLLGVFLQDDIPLGERVHLTLGGRYTFAAVEAGRVRDPRTGLPTSFAQDWNNAVGSARLLWNPDDQKEWAWYGGASQGFRAPNLSDVSRFDIARSGELETAAFGLKPEQFLTLETGVKVVKPNWDASAAYYYTFIDDLIVRTPTGNIIGGAAEVTKRNAGQGFVHGVELAGNFYLGEGFSLFGSVAWQEGQADSFPTATATAVRAPMSRMHPLMAVPGLRWDSVNPRLPIFVEVFGLLAVQQDRLSPDDVRDTQRIPPGGTPGYATLNLRTGYDWKGKVKVVAAVENLLDEDYRIHGSGYNQPGRNFKLSLEYRF